MTEELSYEKATSEKRLKQYLESKFLIKGILFLTSLIIIGVIYLIVFAKWTPTVYGTGQVIAFDPNNRVQTIDSPINGKVSKWHIREGSEVKKGQLLANIKDLDPNRLERLQNKLDAKLDQAGALRDSEKRSKIHAERMKKPFEKGIESKREFELAEISLFKIISEKNKVLSEIEDIKTKLSVQSTQELRSPYNGFIMNIFIPEATQVFKEGDTLAKIVPTEVEPSVELKIKGMDLPLIETGQKVRLAFEGWPQIQVVGWPSTAIGTFSGIIKVIDASDDGKGNFRIIVSPDEEDIQWPINLVRMGSKAKGWIQLKEVPLWWNIWRSFSGIPANVDLDSKDRFKTKLKK